MITVYPKDMKDDMTGDVNAKMFDALEVERTRYFNEECNAVSQRTGSSHDSQPQRSAASEKSKRAVFTLDGESLHLSSTQDYILSRLNNSGPFHVEFLKFCAACSLAEQANDKTQCYKLMKQFNRKMTYNKAPTQPQWLKHVLDKWKRHNLFSAADLKTFKTFLCNWPSIRSKAFTIQNIQSGWRLSGLYPFDPIRMLEFWPFWRELADQEKGEEILQAIDLLAVDLREDVALNNESPGFLTEDLLRNRLLHIIGPPGVNDIDNFSLEEYSDDDDGGSESENDETAEPALKKARAVKPLNERPTNHQRCIWLNNSAFLISEHNKLLKKKEEEEEQRRLKAIRDKKRKDKANLKQKQQQQQQQQLVRGSKQRTKNAKQNVTQAPL